MKVIAQAVILTIVCTGAAQAAQKCSVVGQWIDTRGGTATFRTNKAGTATAPTLCGTAYRLSVTDLTETVFDVSATTKNQSCPAWIAEMEFKGGCDVAHGKITVSGAGVYNDTWTKAGTLKSK